MDKYLVAIIAVCLIILSAKFIKGFVKTLLIIGISAFGVWYLYSHGLLDDVLNLISQFRNVYL